MLGIFDTHAKKREKFFSPLKKGYWPDLYGTEYSLYDAYPTSQKEIDEIRLITQRIGHIFFKTAKLLRTLPDEALYDMDFPASTYPYLRMKTIIPESVIARVDLVKTDEGYKCLEINADTPTFIMECFRINGLVCDEFGISDPNAGEEKRLATAVNKVVVDSYAAMGGKGIPHVVFTSLGDHVEDKNTALYLMELSGLVNAEYHPFEALVVQSDGLYDGNGKKIDVLYRQTWPIEQLVLDVNPDNGSPIGEMLLEHVVHNRLAVVNPPSAFLLQSKGVQVLIWGLHYDEDEFFTEEEHQWIEQYFLPTYFEPDMFIEAEDGPWPYVEKPCFGREGNTVTIYNGNGTPMFQDANSDYTDSAPIYQDYVELPETTVMTVDGKRKVHILTGCFLVEGTSSAIGLRVGGMITDNLSYYLPIGIKE